jgi:group I intron endonuclease
LDFSHSEESKAKISYTLSNKSDEYKAKHKAKIQAARGKPVTVKNLETNETVDYPSIREAARALKVSDVTIAKYIKKSGIFKGYFISYKDL